MEAHLLHPGVELEAVVKVPRRTGLVHETLRAMLSEFE